MTIKEIIQKLRTTMDDARGQESHFESWLTQNEGICDAIDALKELDKSEPVAIADGTFNCSAPLGTPLYALPQPSALLTDAQVKRLIVEFAKEYQDFDSLPEVCLLIDYDPDIGKIPPRWEPKWHVFQAVQYVLHAADGIKNN